MGTVQEHGALVNRPMIFISHTHTSVQTIDSSNHCPILCCPCWFCVPYIATWGDYSLRAEWSRYERTC